MRGATGLNYLHLGGPHTGWHFLLLNKALKVREVNFHLDTVINFSVTRSWDLHQLVYFWQNKACKTQSLGWGVPFLYILRKLAFWKKNVALLKFKLNIEMHFRTFCQFHIPKRSSSKYALNFLFSTLLCNWKIVLTFTVKIQLYSCEQLK